MRWTLFAAALLATVSLHVQSPSAGVSRELAQSRAARVSDIRYDLQLELNRHAETLPGAETVQFQLNDASSDLAIDYRDGTLKSATLNGSAISPALVNGHLVLPTAMLRSGSNTLETHFASRIAKAGAAITRYDDKEDGNEYFYSLFVPMDADMAFPCFDQPDLKAKFTLQVATPIDPNIKVVSNGIRLDGPQTSGNGQHFYFRFAETKPISTYLFAFAAGPWNVIHGKPGEPDIYVRRSQLKRAVAEAPHVQQITARGMTFLEDYFQQPFPFPKYDQVLIPGFPFGGMEHAGATFLNETGVLFRSAPTEDDRFTRDTLVLHELTHQWFGDLVTMRWFDDLWLKEGFAQYMAYRSLQELNPASQPWKHMYEGIKPLAYGIDETEGTTPISQNIPNLLDAKSAYGAIVYQKAPSILKQLAFFLGEDGFRNGLRAYLHDHAYANAQWSDLVNALQTASHRDVQTWARAWVLQRGMPEIRATWTCNAGRLNSISLTQTPVLGGAAVWPISNEVLLANADGTRKRVRMDWSGASTTMVDVASPCPAYVFANVGDEAYGRFLLDAKSEAAVKKVLLDGSTANDPLLSSMLWGALWENVHTAQSAPRGYVELALKDLPQQNDEALARIQYARVSTALQRYMGDTVRKPFVSEYERIATDRMLHANAEGLRINAFRALRGAAENPAALNTLKGLLAGSVSIPQVELRPQDRWSVVGRLIAVNDADAPKLLAEEQKRDATDDGRKSAFAVQAGAPDAAVKQRYFSMYVTPPSDANAQQEDWLSQSLGAFNNVQQAGLTLPYLRRSLDQLPEIKHDRKIFFLGAWLGAFLGGQTSPEAQRIVDAWLAQTNMDADLRRKVLENRDGLDRTVRIRAKFPESH